MILDELQYVDLNKTFFSDSSITTTSSDESISNSIHNILFTTKGEKVGAPEFGTNLKSLLFSQMDSITEHLIKTDIIDALNAFEPRIEVTSVKISSQYDDNAYRVIIYYKVIKSPEAQSKFVSILKRL